MADLVRSYRGIKIDVSAVIENGCTVETVRFIYDSQVYAFRGAYGNAQRAAERQIARLLGMTLCPHCDDVTCPEAPVCSFCYARMYGQNRVGGEIPAGVDW
jgi:hypothetical protein